MKLFGVHIDLDKNYTDAELEELERQLDDGFRRAARLIVGCTAIVCAALVLGAYLWQVCH